MELGIVGAGKMGANIARRLNRAGHQCAVFDANIAIAQELASEGIRACNTLEDLVASLPRPRALWLMVPHGEPTEFAFKHLLGLLSSDDVIIDGGNSHFQDAIRRADLAEGHGLHFLDIGTSGGVHGLERGYCLMIGGPETAYQRLEPIFSTLSPGEGSAEAPAKNGYLYCGGSGAGHYAKMIHNGIEYGMMQAFAEGFDLLGSAQTQDYHFNFDLGQVAEVWRRGSVVSSWLLDLTAEALQESPQLEEFSSEVADSGEGRWTVNAAVDQSVPAPVLTAALFARFRSRKTPSFADKLLSAMRYKFGGHTRPK